IILLCVEPSQAGAVLEYLNEKKISEKTLIISVAAGVTIKNLGNFLGLKCPIIRAMPNSPAQMRQGTIVLCRGASALPVHIETAKSIFSSVGTVFELDEKHFDVITALVGSGP